MGLSCVCCLTRVTPLPTQRGRVATEVKHVSIRRGGSGCRHNSGRRHRRIQTQGFGAHAKRGVDASGAMGAPSGPPASLPSASRRSGVGTEERSASGPRASLPASQSGVSKAKRSVDTSRAIGAPSGPRESLPSASRRSGVGTEERSVSISDTRVRGPCQEPVSHRPPIRVGRKMRMPSERDAMNGPGQDDDGSGAYSDQELRGGPSEAHSNQGRWVGGEENDSDGFLARQIAKRDVSALEAVYNRYSRPVYSLARRLLRDDETTEEVVQEVFMRLWTRADEFDSARGRLLPWLLTITHHRAIDELRRRRARGQHDDIDIVLATAEAADGDPAHEAALAETREAVRQALQHLPEAQRRPIELAYFGGLSQAEIATMLDEPLGTIKTRMRLALQKLREFLRADHSPIAQRLPIREGGGGQAERISVGRGGGGDMDRRLPDPTPRRVPAS